jgi:acylphosphatase
LLGVTEKWLGMTKITQNNKMADVARLSATVYGRVQGVFFRYFVRNVAGGLGLKGYVRNLASGVAVEVQAEGEKGQLNKLLGELKAGPPGARVERVEVKWANYSGQFDDFTVRY